MFGSQVLEVALGIVFVFLLVSIMCSAIREGVESLLKTRAAYLENAIVQLLSGSNSPRTASDLASAFYGHPLITSLSSTSPTRRTRVALPGILARGGDHPSYIPSRNFALALLDIAARGRATDYVSSDPASPVLTLESARANILNIGSASVQRVMLTAIDLAEGDMTKAQAFIEAWYDSAMQRVSGWYKRSTQWILFWIGLVVAVSLNVNPITISDYLYRNQASRQALVAHAETASADTGYLRRSYSEVRSTLDSLALPIGWSNGWGAAQQGSRREHFEFWADVAAPLLGWLLTAIAAVMGAPFWFDILNKVTALRTATKPKERAADSPLAETPSAQTMARSGAASARGPLPARGTTQPDVPRAPTPRDADSSVDGCDVDATAMTPDEDLPHAEGGVA